MTKLSLKINRKYKKFSCNEHRCLGLVIGLTGLLIREPKRFRSLLLIFFYFYFQGFGFFFPPFCLKSLPCLLPPQTGGQRKLLLIGSSVLFFFFFFKSQPTGPIIKLPGLRRKLADRDRDSSCLPELRAPSSSARPVCWQGKSICF